MFVLRVYGLSAAQLTGNLKLKEKAHQSPLSAFCARTQNKARQQGGLHSQAIATPARVCLVCNAPGMQGTEGGENMDSPPSSPSPSQAHHCSEDISSGWTGKKAMGFSCGTASKIEKIDLKANCECHKL